MKIKYHLLGEALVAATLLIGGIFAIGIAFVGLVAAMIWTVIHLGWLMIPVWIFVVLVIGFTIAFYIELHKEFMQEQKQIVDTLRR